MTTARTVLHSTGRSDDTSTRQRRRLQRRRLVRQELMALAVLAVVLGVTLVLLGMQWLGGASTAASSLDHTPQLSEVAHDIGWS